MPEEIRWIATLQKTRSGMEQQKMNGIGHGMRTPGMTTVQQPKRKESKMEIQLTTSTTAKEDSKDGKEERKEEKDSKEKEDFIPMAKESKEEKRKEKDGNPKVKEKARENGTSVGNQDTWQEIVHREEMRRGRATSAERSDTWPRIADQESGTLKKEKKQFAGW